MQTAPSRYLCACALGLSLNAGFALAQRPPHSPPAFVKQVPLVNLTLVVTGPGGKPYLQLQPGDLEVLENGQPQKLINFRPAWTPQASATAAGGSGRSQGVPSPATAGPAGRLRYVAFAVDELALSPLQRTRLVADLSGFFARPPAQPTLYAIFAMRHGLKLVQTFTDDPELLRAAVAKLARDPLGPSRREVVNNLLQDLNDCRCLTGNNELNAGVRGSAPTGNLFAIMASGSTPQSSLQAAHRCGFEIAHSFRGQQEDISHAQVGDLQELITLLGVIPGQKQVVYLGNGFLLDPGSLAYSAYASYFDPEPLYAGQLVHQMSLRELAAAAQASNVSVDAFDLLSLRADSLSGNIGGSFYAGGAGQSHAPGDTKSLQGPVAAMQFLIQRDRASGNSLLRLASDTGGRAYLYRNRWQSTLTEATHNLAGTYYAAYMPTNRRLDGSYRAITVRLRPQAGGRLAGIRVRTRPGYFARRWQALPVHFQVQPPTLYDGKLMTAIRCSLPVKALHWHKRQGKRYDQLVALERIFDQRGRILHRQFYAWPIEPGKDGRVNFGFGFFLPPGKYFCLVRIQEPDGRRLAELSTPITVAK